jgi:hypothetical protein
MTEGIAPKVPLRVQGSKGRGKDRGNGRVVVTKLETVKSPDGDDVCQWTTQKVLHVPKTAYFKDYSDMDIHEKGNQTVVRVAITSQEDAAVWIGQMDLEELEFVGDGTVLHFPRSSDGCKQLYCNIEGIHFIDECVLISHCVHLSPSGCPIQAV